MPRDKGHRERLLEAAKRLVLAKGLAGTRVDEICLAAGVTKGSFYHHFESKEQIAAALVEDFFALMAEALSQGGWADRADPVQRVLGFLDRSVVVAQGPLLRQGCILGSLSGEIAAIDPELRKTIARKFHVVIAMIAPHVEAALIGRGRAKSLARLEADRLARQFMAVLEGAILLGKAIESKDELANALACLRSMVAAMLGAVGQGD